MRRKELLKIRDALLKEESLFGGKGEMFWLSYCYPNRPEGQQFIGVVIVQAEGFFHAVKKARDLGISPGGEVRGEVLHHDWVEEFQSRGLLNRLLSRQELDEAHLI